MSEGLITGLAPDLDSTGVQPRKALKEQLRLFAFTGTTPLPPDVLSRVNKELDKRERLGALLEGELNFHGESSKYASHDLHAFAAKFPPQLPRVFIRGLTCPGDVVLDPMMGSGTAVLEALLEGRRGVGLDIDPLALRLTRVKSTTLDIDGLRDAGYKVLSRANQFIADGGRTRYELDQRFDPQTKEFINYWFFPTTQCELMALLLAIEEIADPSARRFLELTFSSVIITKSGGVSRARDLAHSRPHRVETKLPKNALEQFAARLQKSLISIARLKNNGMSAAPLVGSACSIPLADETVDLIVTSPPYANAIDYMRAHKFSLVWLGERISTLSELRARYIGSERVAGMGYGALPARPEAIIRQLEFLDKGKANVLRKYFAEMISVLAEMYRVLRKESAAVVVVGTSTMRNIDVQTHYCLSDIAAGVGFDVVGVVRRNIDRNKRMMPARFGKQSDSMIEQRMHDEYVIGMLKPALTGKS